MERAASFAARREARSGGTLIRSRSRGPEARRRGRVPRRGHSRHHQGAAAIRRLLRRGLSGLADLASHGRSRRRKGRARRTRRAFRDVRFRSDRRGDAFGVGDVSAPRRSNVEVDRWNQCRRRRALQSFVWRRHWRRTDHHRRRLRRRLVDHAGAQPRLRPEIANLAPRSAPEPADAGAHGRGGFALSEASNTPVMLEVRIRTCHVHGQFVAKDNQKPKFTLREALENPVRDVNRIVLPPASFLHEREKLERRGPAAIEFVKEHKLNEIFGPGRRRRRHRHAGRHVQYDDAGAAVSRPSRRLRRLGGRRSMS